MSSLVHLHTHSEYSPLDGLSTVQEILEQVVADGQSAVALTDHGYGSGHPAFAAECAKNDVKPIFGIEAYLVDDKALRTIPTAPYNGEPDGVYEEYVERIKAENSQRRDYYHLILWAKSDEGLRNLYAMSTESHREGMFYKPRMDWATLEKHHEGVMASTACLRGPIAHPMLKYRDEGKAIANIGRLLNIFGDDLFFEIHANGMDKQAVMNQITVDLANRYSVPIIGVADSHFPTKDMHDCHQTWIAVQTNSDVGDDTDFFSDAENLYIQTEVEMREVLSTHLKPEVVDQCIANTGVVAARAGGSIVSSKSTPAYAKTGGHDNDAQRLLSLCLEAWGKRIKNPTAEHYERFEREYKLLVDKKFCGYFLYVWDYVKYAKDNGVLVGPGRGSGAGSLVAYLLAITEIDPVVAGLLFERFMTEGRTSLPDFDVDFPTSKREMMQDYVTNKYGEDHVIRVGTHLRLRNKGVIKDCFRALKSTIDIDPAEQFRDSEAISKIITEAEASTAGLGLSWDDLWAQEGDLLQPYKDKYPTVFSNAERLVGRLRGYGKHAAGIVISVEEPLTGTIPLRSGEEGEQMISQWEMKELENQGKTKYDFLTIRTLDTLQMCVDLVKTTWGTTINPYEWVDEYLDQDVWEQIGLGYTLGIFQIETASGTRMSKEMKPRSTSEMSDMITLVRPGPMRSGLTRTYMKRRAGLEAVSFPDPRLESVLDKTFGTLLYQEDIMATTMVLAGYDGNRADEVRKVLGKKQVEKVKAEGVDFIVGAFQRGMKEHDAVALWEQMAEFAKYSFNRAHAWSYAVIGYWCAWFKVHYPTEFLVACLSTIDKTEIPRFINEARRMNVSVLGPDINQSGRGFQIVNGLEMNIRYGLDSIMGVGDAKVKEIMEHQPYESWEDFRERCSIDKGAMRILAKVGAFDSLVPNRKGLEALLEGEATGEDTQCVFKEIGFDGPNNLPCHFDWSSEPIQIGRSGKPLKSKPLPKKCTKACRNYTAPEAFDVDSVEPYTDREIREIEMEHLGVYLSSTPFDDLDPRILSETSTAEQVEQAPPGLHVVAATVSRVKTHTDRNGNVMAFITLTARTGDLDVVAFARTYQAHRELLADTGRLCIAGIEKTQRNGEWSYRLLELVAPKVNA